MNDVNENKKKIGAPACPVTGKRCAGFTLIEMLTVVIIIGTLTAIAVPQYRRAVQKTQATEAISMLRTINDSAERLAGEFGYKTFKSFSSNPDDKVKATFQYMDRFNTDTVDCTFEANYTQMTCDKFKYLLNQGLGYFSAVKLNKPYQGVEIRLYEGDSPRLGCINNGGGDVCEIYGIDGV